MQLSKFLSILLIILLASSIAVPLIHAGDGGTIFQAADYMELPMVQASDLSGYVVMANGTADSYQAYFKANSATLRSMLFRSRGYSFEMDVSTCQVTYYSSQYNAIVSMTTPMNPLPTTATVDGRSVVYAGAWYNANLEYYCDLWGVKEKIIIYNISTPTNPSADYLQYHLNCYFNSSLTIYANGVGYLHPTNQQFTTTGEVHFNDASNQTIFKLPIPYVSDSTPGLMRGNSTLGYYAATANNGIILINIRVPKAFLDTAVYPVYLDPTIFSDGFEDDFNAWTGTEVSGGCSLTVETNNPHHGDYNAKSVVTEYNQADCYKSGLPSSAVMYHRSYYKFGTLPANNNEFFDISGIGSTDYTNAVFVLVRKSGGNIYWGLANWIGGSETRYYETSPSNPTTGTYYSVEPVRNVTSGVITLWVDGAQKLTQTGLSLSGNNNLIWDGLDYSECAATQTVYFDCVVADSAYIGPESSGTQTNIYSTMTLTLATSFASSTVFGWAAGILHLFGGIGLALGFTGEFPLATWLDLQLNDYFILGGIVAAFLIGSIAFAVFYTRKNED